MFKIRDKGVFLYNFAKSSFQSTENWLTSSTFVYLFEFWIEKQKKNWKKSSWWTVTNCAFLFSPKWVVIEPNCVYMCIRGAENVTMKIFVT